MAYDTITPKKLGAGELAITPLLTTIRTTPLLARDIVKTIDIANNGAVSATVSVHLVGDGDVADNTNVLIPSVSIPPFSMFQWTGAQVTDENDTIQAQSDVAGVCVNISGGEAV